MISAAVTSSEVGSRFRAAALGGMGLDYLLNFNRCRSDDDGKGTTLSTNS